MLLMSVDSRECSSIRVNYVQYTGKRLSCVSVAILHRWEDLGRVTRALSLVPDLPPVQYGNRNTHYRLQAVGNCLSVPFLNHDRLSLNYGMNAVFHSHSMLQMKSCLKTRNLWFQGFFLFQSTIALDIVPWSSVIFFRIFSNFSLLAQVTSPSSVVSVNRFILMNILR